MSDRDKIMQWQQSNDPTLFMDLTKRYEPVVNKFVNQYKTVGVSPSTLRAKANVQLIKALNSYDPNTDTQPITHIYNNMKKISRMASESLMSGHIPEARALQKSTFQISFDNLNDRLGREPSVDEIADEMGWGKKEVARMVNELAGETTASNADFDFYGNSTKMESADKAIIDYLYHELNGMEKVVFEHTFGYGGKSVLNNKEIAKRLNTNEMQVHRIKKKLSKRIQESR
jgi:RNA polymerase sigma factor (sigma-70 family)